MSSHSPEFQQRVLDLHARQARGEAPPAGEISDRQVAEELGMSRREHRAVLQSALAKMGYALSPFEALVRHKFNQPD